MTFKELREGNQYFILHKTDKPFCEIGSVIGVSNLRPKQNMVNGYQAMQPEMIIDISVKVGDATSCRLFRLINLSLIIGRRTVKNWCCPAIRQ